MNARMLLAARWITSLLLVIASIPAVRGHGLAVFLGAAEIAGAVVFVLPRVWRIGGFVLLATIAVAVIVHSMSGHPPLMLLFPALVIVMVMVIQP